jgi:proline iminopeptidase
MSLKSFLFFLCSLVFLSNCTTTKKIKTPEGIAEINYLDIRGVKQYVLIRGENMANPVLLLLHGGPGASETALFRKYLGSLEKHYTIVYWDQKGAGKSYSKSLKGEDITVRNYIEDTHFLTNYLKTRFGKEKIYLIGHSWGSRLGLHVISEKPENYYAFLGVGTELQSYRGELLSYLFTLEKAKETGNKKAIKDLEELGEPQSGNYLTMYNKGFGGVKQKHWLLKLGGEFYKQKSYRKWVFDIILSKEYSILDLFSYAKGSAFSAGNITHDPYFNDLDFFKTFPESRIPLYFISGIADYNTPWKIVKEYHDFVKAPAKEFILFKESGHSPPFEEPERFKKEVLRLFSK